MSTRTWTLGCVALLLVVLGIPPLVLGGIHLILTVSDASVATFRVTLILIAIGVAPMTAGFVLDRWVRQRMGARPRGFDVVERDAENAQGP
jgi:hypothetical protein